MALDEISLVRLFYQAWLHLPKYETKDDTLRPSTRSCHFPGLSLNDESAIPMNAPRPAPRILVFDSGVGGLSVMREIQQRLPGCHYLYASDNAAFPYGTKTEQELVSRVDQVLHQLLHHADAHYGPVDIIVVACNTASTLTLPHIRSHFSQPIVGVVPAIKPAALESITGVIGLLATPATVTRPYTLDLIKNYAANCKVIRVGSSELVSIAEQKLRGETISIDHISNIITPLQDERMDTLVLACTHFPLLRDEITRCLAHKVTLIDSGEAIARRVEFLLRADEKLHDAIAPRTSATQNNCALFTKATREVEQLRPALARFDVFSLEILVN